MKDGCRLSHFNHERRTTAREIVRCSDACPDPIKQRQLRFFCGHERTHLGEDADDRGLPQHGALTAHVGSGDDQQTIG